MAAFDEPLHVGGKHQSESERRRGIANQPANSFQIVNIPISSCGRELLQRVHGFLALDQFCLGYTHGGCGSVHLPMATTGSVALGSVVTTWRSWATIIAR
jgi:hypothetical protein